MTPPPTASRVPSGDQLRPSSSLTQVAFGPNDRLHHCPLGRDQKNLAAEHRRDEIPGGRPRDLPSALRAAADRPEELSPGREERQVALEANGEPVPARRPVLAARKSSRELALRPRGDVEDPKAKATVGGMRPVVEDIARERDLAFTRATSSANDLARSSAASLPLESRWRRRGRCGSARCSAFPSRLRACCRPAPNPSRRSCRGRTV